MSKSIDQRVVQMEFDNKQFEREVGTTLKTLDSLKKGLDLENSSKSLSNLGKIAHSFSIYNISDGVKNISDKFSVLGVVGFTVLQNLTNSAINFGKKISGYVIEPLVSGGSRRALNIQQAKFQFKGLGMDIEKSMEAALYAVKGTSYGLDEAAVVASQLGASGMQAGDEMKKALRSVSGVAAMTGRSYADIGRIFTTVAGNGRLMGMQLTQLSASGINAAAAIAKQMGLTEAQVRDMVSKGQISFEMFYEAMDAAFGEHATKAADLYTGALSNMKAALSRIGESIQSPKYENMRDIFNALTPIIDDVHDALKPLINDFNSFSKLLTYKMVMKLRKVDVAPLVPIFEALKNVAIGLNSVLKPIGKAFRDVFPPKTKKEILSFTESIRDLTAKFKMSKEGAESIRSVFRGVFSVVSTLVHILTYLIQGFMTLFGVTVPLGSGLLGILGSLGDFVTKVSESIKASTIFADALDKLRSILKPTNKEFSLFGKIGSIFVKLASTLGKVFKSIGSYMSEFIKNFNFERVFGIINSGLVAAVLFNFKNFLDNFDWFVRSGSGIVTRVTGILNQVKIALVTYQTSLKADVLLKIAGAIGILAFSLLILSTISPDKMASSLTAITVVFTELMIALGVMTKLISGKKGLAVTSIMSTISLLNGLAVAILTLSVAMKIISTMDWNGIGKGLVTVAGLLGMLVLTNKLMGPAQKGLVRTSVGMVIFAGAILILSSAVKKLGSIDLGQLAKGLGGVAVLLASLVIFTKTAKMDAMGVKSAMGMLIMSSAILILSESVKKLSGLDLSSMVAGLIGVVTILTSVSIFTNSINDKKLFATSIGLLAVSTSMMIFSKAVEKMGGMSPAELARGLGSLAIGLTVMSIAVRSASKSLQGAVALTIMSVAIGMLVPSLVILAAMPFEGIVKGITALAAIILTLGVTSMALAPAVGPMLAITGAIALLGVSVALVGSGILLLSAGLTGLAVSGVAGATALVAIISSSVSVIPLIISKIGEGLVELAKIILKHIPDINKSILELIVATIVVLTENMPKIVTKGIDLVLALISGITSKLPEVIDAAFKLVITFVNGLAEALRGNTADLLSAIENLMKAVMEAGVKALTDFIPKFLDVGKDLIGGLVKGIKEKTKDAVDALKNVGSTVLSKLKDVFGIASPAKTTKEIGKNTVVGLVEGVKNNKKMALDEYGSFGNQAVKSLAKGIKETKTAEIEAYKKGQDVVKATDDALNETQDGVPAKEALGKNISKGIAKGIKDDTSAEEAAKKKAEAIVKEFRGAMEKLDLSLSTMNLEHELWGVQNESGTTGSKLAREVEYLSNKILIQQDKVNNAASEYQALVKKMGEKDNATRESYNRYLQEKIELTKISNQLKDIDKNATEQYFEFLRTEGKRLQEMKFTAEEIVQMAKNKTGYGMIDGNFSDEVNKSMSNAVEKSVNSSMKTVSTVYKNVAVQTFGTLVTDFDKWGKDYANAIGDGFTSAFKEVMVRIRSILDSMDVEIKDRLQRMAESIKSSFSNMGEPTIRPVVDMSGVNGTINSGKSTISIDTSNVKAPTLGQLHVSKTNGPKDSSITFVQNNHSPKALSRLEVYRQTANQLSKIKEVTAR